MLLKRNNLLSTKTLTFPIAIILMLSLASCSFYSGPSDEEIRLAHLRQIDSDKQQECNLDGKFYDNLAQTGSCSDHYFVSDWQCNYENIKINVEANSGDIFAHRLVDLENKINKGFVVHQCGKGDFGFKIIAIKQTSNKNHAETQVISFEFPYVWPTETSTVPEIDDDREASAEEIGEYSEDMSEISEEFRVPTDHDISYEENLNETNEINHGEESDELDGW